MTTTSQPQSPQRFGLPESAIQAIQELLAAHPEVEQAIVYGSRAMGRQRPASDIDLTLICPAIGFGTLARIEDELDDLLLPWMIDLSRLADLSHPPLLAHVERVGQLADHPGWARRCRSCGRRPRRNCWSYSASCHGLRHQPQ